MPQLAMTEKSSTQQTHKFLINWLYIYLKFDNIFVKLTIIF